MIYNKSFTVILDDLSEYIDTHDKLLLKEDMLQLAYKNDIINRINKACIEVLSIVNER